MRTLCAMQQLVTAQQAADILGVSVFTVARLAQTGELATAIKAPGTRGARFFDLAAVNALKGTQ
jgi:hypothetical protein